MIIESVCVQHVSKCQCSTSMSSPKCTYFQMKLLVRTISICSTSVWSEMHMGSDLLMTEVSLQSYFYKLDKSVCKGRSSWKNDEEFSKLNHIWIHARFGIQKRQVGLAWNFGSKLNNSLNYIFIIWVSRVVLFKHRVFAWIKAALFTLWKISIEPELEHIKFDTFIIEK